FDTMNLSVVIQNWTQFTTGHKITKPKPRFITSQNIEGSHPGIRKDSEKIVIFNAHYDTVKTSPGADDDGSGVAAVLAAAEILSQFQFNHTLKFVTFSGEEMGLYGSHAYAKHAYENNDDIYIAFNADMIGHADTSQGGKLFRLYATKDIQYTIDNIININTSLNLGFNFHTGTLPEQGSGGSDYFSFVEYGYEALAFFEGEWNPAMHSMDDTIENMNISYLVNTSKLIVATLAYYADAPLTHPQVRIESPQKGHIYLEAKQKKEIQDLQTIVIDDIWIWADVTPGDAPIESVKFYYDGRLKYTDFNYPYKWQYNLRSFRSHTISVVVRDVEGREAEGFSDILFLNPWIRR
ncbi:MAG: M20/M25/M40 family metallo-hydrolase, partial [Candidatus Thermoplasmatota archaeon]|nr:M20/M25/M40 family metallo-hydrolase [Candidatus Thermoplasmatota archaeon]MBU1941252.1 M20/M25/M40 family metallo-hydrolase [Candidatus Thermoplasmatota archaeon]